ncbi:MAG: lysophospholipid acyltransferase family protein [Pirellulaceae bacterium]
MKHQSSDAVRPALIDYLVTPVFLACMLTILLVFHVLQVLARLVSVRLQEQMYDYLCWFLLLNLRFVARARFDVHVPEKLPTTAPLVFVSNHQSMFDIPLEGWYLRAYRPRFVAKRELGRWVPAISFALRTLGHVLIDRHDARQSIRAIKDFARALVVTGRSAAIYPEGTRSRDGTMAPFKGAGLLTVLKELPAATVVPIALDGTWKLERHRMVPIPVGIRMTLHVLPVVDAASYPRRELTEYLDGLIRTELDRIRASAD